LTGALTITAGGLNVNGGIALNNGLDVNGGVQVMTGGVLIDAGSLTVTEDGITVTAGGVTIVAGGLEITAGGGTITAGGLDVVAGGATIQAGGIAVTGSSTVTGELTVTVPGTVGSEVVNFSQFPSTIAVIGSQTLPSGRIEQWGTGATVNGVGTISFDTAFPNACLNVQLSIGPGSGTASLHPLLWGALAVAGFPVYGDPGESLGFSYVAIGY
jgi:hypothetical protein